MKCARCGKDNFDAEIFCTACNTWLRAQPAGVKTKADVTSPWDVTSQGDITSQAAGLPKISSVRMTVLTLITFGIYLPFWFLKVREPINNLQSKEKIGQGINVFAAVAACLSMLPFFVPRGNVVTANMIDSISSILSLIMGVIVLSESFKVRRILLEHFNTHLQRRIEISGIKTFFGLCIYLQAVINKL
jgi:uncharacterized membrane protein